MPVGARQFNWLRGPIDAACGPVFLLPVGGPSAGPVQAWIVPAMAPASMTLAGRLDSWKPVQQALSAGSSRP
jgi:hypothetical protein